MEPGCWWTYTPGATCKANLKGSCPYKLSAGQQCLYLSINSLWDEVEVTTGTASNCFVHYKIMKLKKKTAKCLVEMLQLIRTIYCRTARFIELLVTKTVYVLFIYIYVCACVKTDDLYWNLEFGGLLVVTTLKTPKLQLKIYLQQATLLAQEADTSVIEWEGEGWLQPRCKA